MESAALGESGSASPESFRQRRSPLVTDVQTSSLSSFSSSPEPAAATADNHPTHSGETPGAAGSSEAAHDPPMTPYAQEMLEALYSGCAHDQFYTHDIGLSALGTISSRKPAAARAASSAAGGSFPFTSSRNNKKKSVLATGTDYVKRYFTDVAPEKGKECTYSDIELALGKSYVDASNTHFSSNALDVLALYIKGQKLLYTESKTYCEQQLNFLMLPAIFISCVGSIFSFLSDRYVDGPLIIASLNGFNAFLLALISYLKLDAKAQAHKTSAYKFDKLESMCEFNSGKFMFFVNDDAAIMDVVSKIEHEVKEIKETNQFILPETIRYEFSFTYSTNIFMLVKKIQSMEMVETHSLKNCVNYINTLNRQIDLVTRASAAAASASPSAQEQQNAKYQKLVAALRAEEKRKNQFVENILECRKRYFEMDEEFNREIEKHIRRSNRSFVLRALCCDWLKS
jgi:hypothetical protein